MTLFKTLKTAALALCAVACATAAAPPAYSGEWRLDPRRCPDIVEDRLDRLVVTGRADLREDRRDMRRTVCPASAWVYAPGPRERVARGLVYTGPTVVHVGRSGYFYYPPRRGLFRRRPAPVRIAVVVR